MVVLSLFDGISCGQLALQRAGVSVSKYYASEIDKTAMAITQRHFPDTIQIGDATQLDFTAYRCDLLIGGSPCQTLSGCNTKKLGLNGESKLFFEYVRALKEINPRWYFFENVGSMTKENMEIISSYFGHLPIRMNSNLVSAQNRDRYYWTNIPYKGPPKDRGINVCNIIEDSVERSYYLRYDYNYTEIKDHKSKNGLVCIGGIKGRRGLWIDDGKEQQRNFSQGNRIYSIRGKSPCVNANSGGLGGKSGLYYLEDGQELSKENIRRLTPLEVERLQTLPDNYTAGFPETHRYKAIGNAWTVDIITHVFSYFKNNGENIMNEEKRCSNCAFPNMDRGYFGCAPMDFVPLTPFSTCIKWTPQHGTMEVTNPVDEEEIPAELLGIAVAPEPAKEKTEVTIEDRSVLDILLSDIAEEEPVIEAECAPKHTMNTIGDYLPDENTGALDAIAKVLPRLPDMIDEVAAMEPEEKEAFIADIKADMRADIPEYTPEELVAMTREVEIINKHDGDESVYANAVGTLDSQKYPDLLTLTYRGCAIAVPATDAVLDINKKFKQFVDKNVVAW